MQDQFWPEIHRKGNEGRELAFEIDDDGLLARTGDKGIQKVAPHFLKERIVHINHFALLVGHQGRRKRYHRIFKDLYRPTLAVYCYETVRKCPHCARKRIELWKNVTKLQLFPATEPLRAVCKITLGEIIKTQRRNEYLIGSIRWPRPCRWSSYRQRRYPNTS